MCFEICVTLLAWSMKRKTIRKDINKTMTWCEFFVKWVKGRENLVELIIHVDNRTFDF